jgi:hypothetical protein
MADHFDDDPAAQLRREIKNGIDQDTGFSPAARAAAMRAAALFAEAENRWQEAREAAFEQHIRSGATTMSADYAAKLAGLGMIDDNGDMKGYYFEHIGVRGR